MTLEASIPVDDVKRILPSSSSLADDGSMTVSVQCAPTKLRQLVRLEQVGEVRWRGEVTLHRHQVAGVVRLVPRLLRRTDIPTGHEVPTSAVALHKNAVIGEGPSVALVVDEQIRPPGRGITIKWEDFRTSENSWRRDHPTTVWHLEPYGERPILWLNSRYEKFRAILYSRTNRGPEAVMRHLLNGLVAQSVWEMLGIDAIGSATEDETTGAVQPPSTSWKTGVLSKILSKIFPGLPEDTRLAEALNKLKEPDEVGVLLSLVATAAEEIVGTHKLIDSAIKAAENIQGAQE